MLKTQIGGTTKLSYHIKLLIGGGKVNRSTSTVILSDEIRIRLHDFGKLLGISQANSAVKCNGRILGHRRVSENASK